MKRRRFIQTTGAAGLFTFFSPQGLSDFFSPNADVLSEENFLHPPSSAFPQTLWFWMNGNVTKEGITFDLEAMKDVGIGGVLNLGKTVDLRLSAKYHNILTENGSTSFITPQLGIDIRL